MTKNTKIALGIGAAIVLYLILKPKKTSATTTGSTTTDGTTSPAPSGVGIVQTPEGPLAVLPDHANGGVDQTPIDYAPNSGDDKIKTTVEPQTKDCVQVGYDCTKNTYNTIQIPLDADCANYQPAMPPCAGPMGGGGDRFMVAPEFLPSSTLSNFA